MRIRRILAWGVVLAMLCLAGCIIGWILSLFFPLMGCSKAQAQGSIGCQHASVPAGLLSQEWSLAALPEGVTPGFYVVYLTDGEPSLAAVQADGQTYDLILQIPGSSIGSEAPQEIQTADGIQQLGCPAITG